MGNCQDSIDCVILHGFSDASDSTYAACIYLKYVTKLGESIITFITAKSRITQVEKKLKRMELLGNLILSRLMKRVLCAFQNELFIREYFCCTDSMINIHRINWSKRELCAFEESRLKEICDNVEPHKWFHCISGENPANADYKV